MLHKGNISNIHICPENVTDCVAGGAYTAWSSEVNPDAIRVSKYRMEERGR